MLSGREIFFCCFHYNSLRFSISTFHLISFSLFVIIIIMVDSFPLPPYPRAHAVARVLYGFECEGHSDAAWFRFTERNAETRTLP